MEKENKIEKQSEAAEVKQEPKNEQVPEVKTPEQPTEQKESKEPTEEPKKSDDHQKEVEELTRQLNEAIEQAKQVDVLNNTVSNMKAEMESKDNTIRDYENLLQNLFDTKMQQIPEQFKDLVPDDLDLKQKLSWLEKAESKGLFDKKEKLAPTVEVGKPMNVEVPKVDTSKMGASDLLRMAFSSVKK